MLVFKRTLVTAGYLLEGAFQAVLLCFLRYVKLGNFNDRYVPSAAFQSLTLFWEWYYRDPELLLEVLVMHSRQKGNL